MGHRGPGMSDASFLTEHAFECGKKKREKEIQSRERKKGSNKRSHPTFKGRELRGSYNRLKGKDGRFRLGSKNSSAKKDSSRA